MYLFLQLFLPLLLLLLILNHFRRKNNIQKVRSMSMDDKCRLLNELLAPFGYGYIPAQDIFTSRIDSWQRKMNYGALYDTVASFFNMVFDSFPVYFNYHGRTWLLQFWKGQYGINTGAEIGLYYADRILDESERKYTFFKPVEDRDMTCMSLTLFHHNNCLAQLHARHWWLTAFIPGYFSRPSDLSLHASVTFPNAEMARAFINGLHAAGYSFEDICYQCNTVTFSFTDSINRPGFFRRLRIGMVQLSNRIWCKLYLYITRPFDLSMDRILYLYYYLPFAFRKTLRIRRYKSERRRKRGAR